MSAAVDAVERNLDLIFDRRVGIVGNIAERPGIAGLFHATAATCDPSVFGAAAGPFTASAAAPDRRSARAAAVRRALARYCAALYQRAGLPLATAADAGFPCVPPAEFALFSAAQYGRPGFPYVPFDEKTPVRWGSAVDLASSDTRYVPAALVWHPYTWLRSGGDLPIVEPTLSGLAAAESVGAATLAGLYDVVLRDALALFWQAATAPPRVRLDTAPENIRALAGRFEAIGAGVTVVDVTTNNRIPAFAAIATSPEPDQPAFAFGAAANLDPVAAVAAAILDLAETRRLAAEARRTRTPPSPANDWEDATGWADHLTFAADHANRHTIAFALASDDRRNLVDYEKGGTGDADADLETAAARVLATGCRPLAANLTSEDVGALGFAVIRVLVPGYQPLVARHRARGLGGTRLYDVPQRLGYRGIPRGSAGNPAPHPFAGEFAR